MGTMSCKLSITFHFLVDGIWHLLYPRKPMVPNQRDTPRLEEVLVYHLDITFNLFRLTSQYRNRRKASSNSCRGGPGTYSRDLERAVRPHRPLSGLTSSCLQTCGPSRGWKSSLAKYSLSSSFPFLSTFPRCFFSSLA
jgi:hypothetical protein